MALTGGLPPVVNEHLGKNFYNLVNDYRVEEVKKRLTKGIMIRLATTGLDNDVLEGLRGALSRHRGAIPVTLFFQDPSGKRISISAGKRFSVSPDDFLIDEIEKLCGSGSVKLQT